LPLPKNQTAMYLLLLICILTDLISDNRNRTI
jgi:hypothetical protein